MKIIGGKDYYDGVAGYDSDRTLVFVRAKFHQMEPTVAGNSSRFSGVRTFPYNVAKAGEVSYGKSDYRSIAVIFCGKLYQGVFRTSLNYEAMNFTHSPKTVYHVFWTKESLQADVESRGLELRKIGWRWAREDSSATYYEHTDVAISGMETLLDEGIIHTIGLETRQGFSWYDNSDGLKNVGFPSVIEPWTAHQEIEMFLGTILVREEDNRVRLADKELIAKHGFDEKSFRNTHHSGKPRKRT